MPFKIQKQTSLFPLLSFLFFSLIIFSKPFNASAQENFTLSGYIKDGKTGEDLIGASIYIEELKTGSVTNVYGFYSITLKKGTYNFRFSYIGFDAQNFEIDLSSSKKLDVKLGMASTQLKAVEITSERQDANVKTNQMSVVKMDISEIKSLPVMFGETDIIKSLTLMPGVATAGDGNSGLYVRGGGPDQNLILIDDAPVYNASHLLGFFSVFNADALKDVQLYKGGIPAGYGGRISSVLDVKLKEGNSQNFNASGGLGLISSRLTLEGPLVKDKSSFIVSGRRTYADVFLKASNNQGLRNSTLYFYDLNMKANYILSDKDRIFVSGYFGRDVFGFNDMLGFDWGNTTATVRWNHLFNDKLFMNTSLIYSKYDYGFDIGVDNTEIRLHSGIEDYNIKADWDWFPNINNNVKFGVNSIFHNFSMPSFTSNLPGLEEMTIPSKFALESVIYISNDQSLTDKLSLSYGLRYSVFNLMGASDIYGFNEQRTRVIDTTSYASGEIYKSYGGLEPRMAVTYLLSEKSSVKASYNRMMQYMHLLSNGSAGSPTDLWIPSSEILKPQIGDQVAAGYFRNFLDNMFETSVELYYKTMQNQVDYKNGANIVFNPTIETELLFGKGWAYGAEFFIKKRHGKFNGWIGYTISRSMRQIEGINDNEPYPQRYDRTHDINILLSYALSPKLKLASTWVYATGNPVTFPAGRYTYQGNVVSYYTERNAHRLPDYHRMDLSVNYEPKAGSTDRKFYSSWNFSVFNVYARENPFMITFRDSETNPGQQEAVQVALFKMIPSITWNFKF
ncbi:MAG: TonB-dependent receptor [Bacteroidetes bacterium]|nr:TonB-dependent receptor [Bacteroidota bacterium]